MVDLSQGLGDLILGKKELDADLLEDIETQLIMADVGIETTRKLVAELTRQVTRRELKNPEALYEALARIRNRLATCVQAKLGAAVAEGLT